MSDTWDIKGLTELNQTIIALTKSLGPDQAEPIFKNAAQHMSKAIRANIDSLTKKKTGNLRRSVVTKQLKPLAWNQPAASISAIDFKKAPHAWLVEYGHELPDGGRVEEKGYFRKAVDETEDFVWSMVTAGMEKLIDKAVK